MSPDAAAKVAALRWQTHVFAMCRLLAVVLALTFLPPSAADRLARPGYHFEFPRDHFSHPEYQTEWWYYTGNLATSAGRQFGFEVTFFRFHQPDAPAAAERNPVWDPSQIYIAHFALTDINEQRFYHQERVNRRGPRLAGASESEREIWNGNWSARWLSFTPIRQELQAVSEQATLRLSLLSKKPPVIHGQGGVSMKGSKPGEASHYYSLTRIATSGTLKFEGNDYQVTGEAWMDREFFTAVPDDPVRGWDWMCIQLDSNEELMLYRLRLKDGTISPYSSGTLIDAAGRATPLRASDISLKPGRTWHSAETGGDYPTEWDITVPSKDLKLRLTTPLQKQELVNGVTRSYWEGAVRYHGIEAGTEVNGQGYLEMTGYERHAR
jgi:predicted secreted hydrolase